MQKRNLSLLLSLTLLLILALASIVHSLTLDETAIIKRYLLNNYVEKLSEEDLQGSTPEELVENLDIHTEYYTSEEFQSMMENLRGQFYGIGVQIRDINGQTFIAEVMEGGPAQEAKLQMGDIIVAVDGVDIRERSLNQVVEIIRGARDTQVKIGIERFDHEEILIFPIRRGPITLHPVEYKAIDDIGYIKLESFDSQLMKGMLGALKDFEDQGIEKIIIDVRNNPGGSLNEVISLSQLFIPRGPIVHIESRENKVTHSSSLQQPSVEDLVVLVNENSASASEIFAAAVQDTGAGIVIGNTTLGKGSVQRIFQLPTGAGLKMTEARYLSPRGNGIDGIGVKPDVKVDRFSEELLSMNLLPVHILRRVGLGDVGQDVMAAQQRLKLMGYTIEDKEGYFGQSTFEAVKKFQENTEGLFAYGMLDYTTQTKLETAFLDWINSPQQDQQLQYAIEYLNDKIQRVNLEAAN